MKPPKALLANTAVALTLALLALVAYPRPAAADYTLTLTESSPTLLTASIGIVENLAANSWTWTDNDIQAINVWFNPMYFGDNGNGDTTEVLLNNIGANPSTPGFDITFSGSAAIQPYVSGYVQGGTITLTDSTYESFGIQFNYAALPPPPPTVPEPSTAILLVLGLTFIIAVLWKFKGQTNIA